MTAIANPELERLAAFRASLPPCPNGCSRDAIYPTATFNPRDSIEDQVTIHIRKTRQNQDWLLRMHVFETHRYGHLQAASECSADVRQDVDRLLGRLAAVEVQVARIRAFLEDMAGWCSPHGVAADYARRGLDVLDGIDPLDAMVPSSADLAESLGFAMAALQPGAEPVFCHHEETQHSSYETHQAGWGRKTVRTISCPACDARAESSEGEPVLAPTVLNAARCTQACTKRHTNGPGCLMAPDWSKPTTRRKP